MFDYIHGSIVYKKPTELTVEADGIGYKINIPLSTFERLQNKEEAKIFTRLLIKEDELKIYGFSSLTERDLFNLLLSVNGVGPNMALTILSGCSVSQFKKCIVGNDLGTLRHVKGIGKKTAERIILELKETIKGIMPEEVSSVEAQKMELISDAIMAMISLGYARPIAEKAVTSVSDNFDASEGVEALIKKALRHA
ncbi:MAG: Holliday junction branch migration protein RuvA [Candidatus Scalinduaceae bacterium]